MKQKPYFVKCLPVDDLTKLFLCSREVQVGDTVRCFGYPEFETRIIGKDRETLYTSSSPEEASALRNLSFFKIIGEISPDATWVKEGDEFDAAALKEFASQLNQKRC